MAVRIYSFAKELKLDSKELANICTKVGITGKGSALASLTDEEVVKVRDFISSGGKPIPKPVAKSKVPAVRKIEAKTVDMAAPRRKDSLAPLGSNKPKVLSIPPKAIEAKKKTAAEHPRPQRPAGPAIKLAPVPVTAQPSEKAVDNSPPAQKPELKLSVEALKARSSSTPLAEHLRRQEKKRTDEVTRKETKPAPGTTETPAKKGQRRVKGKEAGGDALLGGREQRQAARKRTGTRGRGGRQGGNYRPRNRGIRRTGANTAAPRKGTVSLQLPCTVRSFSEAVGVPFREIQRQLLAMQQMATINSELDNETVEILALELGVEVDFKQAESIEDKVLTAIEDLEDAEETLAPRAPIVTFLGHVDHGKTSLLDYLIGIDVVSGESGGITQHIRAYEVLKDGRKISFVDTPGHEAFTEMRARGANVTDIAVLVVAADDGIMPQTEEAISHARAADVPIIVALNKIDLPNADENKAFQDLAANELLPREWGGEVEVVKTSAITGEGMDDLLEMILFVAEDQEYKANANRPALGTCLEAQLHEGRGVISKFIVQKGTLRVGDPIVCGTAFGKVKAMYDPLRPKIRLTEAGPSTPVDLTGLDIAPEAGERFYVVDDVAQAREIASLRNKDSRTTNLAPPVHVTLENLFDRLEGEETQTLNLIVRADVRGSIEAIQKELEKLKHPEVQIRILQASVGGVTEADVHLADASDAVIVGFNVVPDEGARALAEARGVQVRRYEIIYKLTDDLRNSLEGLLKPEEKEEELGRALVQQTFKISRIGMIAGCRVIGGTIVRNCRVRVIRDNTILGDYALDTLRREKDDTKEARDGMECGIKLAGFNDVKEGDILEAYRIFEVARTLDD